MSWPIIGLSFWAIVWCCLASWFVYGSDMNGSVSCLPEHTFNGGLVLLVLNLDQSGV
jgi:hypothetical protein